MSALGVISIYNIIAATTYSFSVPGVTAIKFLSSTFLLACNQTLSQLQVYNPTNGALLGAAATAGGARDKGLEVNGNYAYVCIGAVIQVFNITTVVPLLVGSVTLPFGVMGMVGSGNYLYVATTTTIYAYSVGTNANPVLLSSVLSPSITLMSISYSNGYISAIGIGGYILVIDAHNPSALSVAVNSLQASIGGGGYCCYFYNGYIYAANYGASTLLAYIVGSNIAPPNGGVVTISGAVPSPYNGTFFAQQSGPSTFTYTINGTVASPATGTILANAYSENYFPYTAYLNDLVTDLLLHEASGLVFKADPTIYQDNLVPIQVHVRTQLWDGGTTDRKYLSKIELVGDKVASTAQLRYTDNDYQTYSSFQPIYLGDEHTMLAQVGSTRRRAFDLLHVDNTPFRAEGLEIEGDMGKGSAG
jgi:hypothetical protein